MKYEAGPRWKTQKCSVNFLKEQRFKQARNMAASGRVDTHAQTLKKTQTCQMNIKSNSDSSN